MADVGYRGYQLRVHLKNAHRNYLQRVLQDFGDEFLHNLHNESEHVIFVSLLGSRALTSD